MTTLAVTGHLDLTGRTERLVLDALTTLLHAHADRKLVGVSCLARGADTLFAQAVLAAGGRLVVVLPSRDYRAAKVRPDHAPTFDRLAAVAEVVTMPYATADRRAYEAANGELLRRADRLVAVWDGTPPTGKGGGTADAVLQARAAGLPVEVIWPAGAVRGA
ncbi:hypothetical protein ACFVFQ_34215 [Streptomyces sp. NPDC057743]|uniref:hypothetical protein n=1 Tax=Streptomyces sp. NPDC057743 TaxID=3346236 RepID=UPI003682761E